MMRDLYITIKWFWQILATYLHRRDYFTAISYYQRALELAREIKDPVSIKKWTFNINLAYARIRAAVDQGNARPAARSAL
jgi:hypothetical protein